MRPLNVVNCLAFPRVSRPPTFCAPAATFGTRRTWLSRNSSFPTRSAYNDPVSRSRVFVKISAVGTSSIYKYPLRQRFLHSVALGNPLKAAVEVPGGRAAMAYIVLDRRTLSGEGGPEESTEIWIE